MKTRIASCTCGALQAQCEGEPTKVSLCCCFSCQRRTGSLFSIAAFFGREQVKTEGRSNAFARDSASGKPVTFHFCPTCGSSVFWAPERMPHLIAIGVGAFADPDFPAPEQAVWMTEAHGLLKLPEPMKTFEANPPPRASSPTDG